MDLRDLSNYGGFIIGFIGIFLSIYLYQKGLEKKQPCCFYKTYREIEKLSSSDDSNIKILYKSNDVDRVFTTYLWLWNKGKKAINQSDIPPQSNIFIKLIDKNHVPKILDYRVLKTSREEINFAVSPNGDDKLALGFDFLDYNDGVVIEIQHTGSYNTEVETEGIILGVPKGIEVSSKQTTSSFLDIFRRIMLPRERITRPTKLFVHKTLRQKIIYVLGNVILFGLLIGFMIWAIRDINSSSRLTNDKLREIITSELSDLPEQTVQNIISKATVKTAGDTIAYYVFVGYAIILSIALIITLWKDLNHPIPKSLYFKDNDGEKKPN